MSLFDTYNDVSMTLEEDKPKFFKLMDEFICWDDIIPDSFYTAFYKKTGRDRVYSLESFLSALVLQRVFGYINDTQLLNTLKYSKEMRDFCGFAKVPDASKITRFKQDFASHIEGLFNKLVDKTEPICKAIDSELSDCLIFDTTGIESYVTENNPKFMNKLLKQAKGISKINPKYDPYKGVYSLMPTSASSNNNVKQQYINGHYCYAQKAGIVTNGLGIVRHISFLDDDFKKRHPDILIGKKSDNPEEDKEIGDSTALKPVLSDFFSAHPQFNYSVFLGDSAFDKYDHYSMLIKEFKFNKAVIPLNSRNSSKLSSEFNEEGTPLCPIDGTPFIYLGKAGGKNRSQRFKWGCPKSKQVGSSRICTCDNPCTDSTYGRCVYTYPDKNLRLYPGIARESEEWYNLYKKRVVVERTINTFKFSLCLDGKKTRNSLTTKTDLLLCGIVQLISVLVANALGKAEGFKKIRKLIA